jgi:hypothetical protein
VAGTGRPNFKTQVKGEIADAVGIESSQIQVVLFGHSFGTNKPFDLRRSSQVDAPAFTTSAVNLG